MVDNDISSMFTGGEGGSKNGEGMDRGVECIAETEYLHSPLDPIPDRWRFTSDNHWSQKEFLLHVIVMIR